CASRRTFFFSSRRRHTRFSRDWSSDVCSSDLTAAIADHVRERDRTCIEPSCSTPARSCELDHIHEWQHGGTTSATNLGPLCTRRSEERRVGKEGRCRWRAEQLTEKIRR